MVACRKRPPPPLAFQQNPLKDTSKPLTSLPTNATIPSLFFPVHSANLFFSALWTLNPQLHFISLYLPSLTNSFNIHYLSFMLSFSIPVRTSTIWA